jgi:hypothetical protein
MTVNGAVLHPADRILKPVVSPKKFVADGEGRRSEDSHLFGGFGLAQ